VPVVIPAIDLLDGQAVRLWRGDPARATAYGDPLAVAAKFASQGARRLHMVDLGAAIGGLPPDLSMLRRLAGELDVDIQYGGGIRSLDAAHAALSAGARRVVAGTAALINPGFLAALTRELGPGRVILGLDIRGGKPLVRGWRGTAESSLPDVLAQALDADVRQVMLTDADGDGTLSGVNRVLATPWLNHGLDIVLAGGVASLEELRELALLTEQGLAGVVVGRALLDGALDWRAAQSAFDMAAEDPASGRR
jgi:phosphoribosylformimino-5-aminoimidazole carboxamide ribotide isomerase